MAFRAWDRGLAATSVSVGDRDAPNAFGVWKFYGTGWFPDPTFPGHSTCQGDTIVWAGKLDYWLVGQGTNQNWPNLCRFDGHNYLWEPLAIPQATLDRVTSPGQMVPMHGGITSATCFSWANCWFFGSYGAIVHWDGNALADASPDSSLGWLQTAFSSGIVRRDQAGNPFGVAVGATSAGPDSPAPLPSQPNGDPPPQMYGSNGSAFSPLSFTPPTTARSGDPYRTDLVAVDFNSDLQGWVAGNPAGLQATQYNDGAQRGSGRPAGTFPTPEPSPLVPVSPTGSAANCPGPPANRFTYTNAATTDPGGAFLWSSISTVPFVGDGLAGGRMWPAKSGPGPNEDGSGEPVIALAGCDGTTTVTRFRIPDPTYSGSGQAPAAAADRTGTVTAIAANAFNDAWAGTSKGIVPGGVAGQFVQQRPHLYRLSDGQPTAAPAGDDEEPPRPLPQQLDPPIIVVERPPAQPAPAPATTVTKSTTVNLPPAVFGMKTKLRGRLHPRLYLSFRLRRPATIGAQALRRGRVVSSSGMRHFAGKTGELVLKLDRKRWPTEVRFVTESPVTTLKDPGTRLSGMVNLLATVSPYRGRRIVSVRFEYTPTGKQTWTPVATVSAPPWTAALDTTKLSPGLYDLRAVATDVSGQVGASLPVIKRLITPGAHA